MSVIVRVTCDVTWEQLIAALRDLSPKVLASETCKLHVEILRNAANSLERELLAAEKP